MLTLTIQNVVFDDEAMQIALSDGRQFSAPLSARLREVTPQQREHWELCAAGTGLHWPLINEDLSLDGLMHAAGLSPVSATRPTNSLPF